MAIDSQTALKKLQESWNALSTQDLSVLPGQQQAALEKSKAAMYQEIQALQVQGITDRDEGYEALTDAFKASQSDLQQLSDWLQQEENQGNEIFSMVTKVVGLALSLLA